jgi:ATP-dependent protease ClpP protease subunit
MKTIVMQGDVGFEITAAKLQSEIDINSKEQLTIVLNSGGGFVFEAFAIYDILQTYKGKINIIIAPFAGSAASYIAMAADTISGFKNSSFMGHRVSGIAIGDADNLRTNADIQEQMENVIIEAYQKRINKSKDEILTMMKNEFWLIGWESMTEAGLLDNVIDKPEDIDYEIPEEEKESIMQGAIAPANMANLKMKIAKTNARVKAASNELSQEARNFCNKILAQKESQEENLPAENAGENKTQESNSMTLEEFRKSSPEAEAEFTAALKSAEAQIRTEANKSTAAILELEGILLSETAANALDVSMDPKDYAFEKLKAEAKKREQPQAGATVTPIFGKLTAPQTPQAQADTSTVNMAEWEKGMKEAAEKYAGGK